MKNTYWSAHLNTWKHPGKVQFKKTWKAPMEECFSRFLNCTNDTKSCNASHLIYMYLSKSRNQVVTMRSTVPCCSPVLLNKRCIIPATQSCWLTEASPEWRNLQFYFLKIIFEFNTVLYLYTVLYITCFMFFSN